jgi:hypothetical protein
MTHITVTVDDSHIGSIDSVAKSLKANGMKVDRVHQAIGFISGSVPSGGEAALASLPGVASVDRDVTYRVPAPNSPVQ